MKRRLPSVRTLLVATAAALAATGAGIAAGAIPTASGQIDGCYTKVGGVLRAIDKAAGQACATKFEVPISWNATGPRGPAGADGAPGAKGDPGEKGDPGAPGDLATLKTYRVTRAPTGVPSNGTVTEVLLCNPGDLAVSGTYELSPSNAQIRTVISVPGTVSTPNDAWQLTVASDDLTIGKQLTGGVLCLDLTP